MLMRAICKFLFIFQDRQGLFFFRQDTFKFTTKVPDTYNPVNTIEFCVCFRTPTGEHWDNNHGQNYRMTCIDPNLLSPDNSELDLNGNMVPELITPPPSSIFYWFLFGFVKQVITLQLLLYLTRTTLFIIHLTKKNFPLWLPDQLLKQNWWQLPTVLVSNESFIEFIVFDQWFFCFYFRDFVKIIFTFCVTALIFEIVVLIS